MRILHVSTRLILGGSQENTVLSCEGQSRLGHEVHLAFGPIYGPEGSLLQRVEAFNARCAAGDERVASVGGAACVRPEGSPALPITTHVVPRLVREVRPWADHTCFHRELKPLVRRLRPDVVHTHSSKAGILGRWAAWAVGNALPARERPAVVHTIHGPPFMPVEGSPARRAKVRAANLAYTLAERFAARRCHAIVSVADAMTSQFLARGIGRARQYVTVRSGMETRAFLHAAPGEDRAAMRAALGLADDAFVVGTVARLAQHKGHDDLLDALGPAMRENPALTLLWVGDGWWRERLVARARGMGLTVAELDRAPAPSAARQGVPAGAPAGSAQASASRAQVVLTGLVSPQRVPGMMRAMDVLAHPSYREGLPRTVPQALLCGVPVVAYDCDGTGEICRHEPAERATGRLVRTGDVHALRGALLWMMTHAGERAAMGARGREECAAAFSSEAMIAGLERVYAGALGAARGEDGA